MKLRDRMERDRLWIFGPLVVAMVLLLLSLPFVGSAS